MSNYSQNVFFAPKDSLTTGDPNKVIKGSEIDAEFQEISDAIATKVETGSVPSGTKMLFIETVAPSGWTLNTAYDDRTILISDGPTNDGTPDTGGSWSVSGLTANSHTHGAGSYSAASPAAGTALLGTNTGGNDLVARSHSHDVTGTSGSSGAVTVSSSAAWRPNYVEVIVCSKD